MKKETMLLSFPRYRGTYVPDAKATRSRVSDRIEAENAPVANRYFSGQSFVLPFASA